MRKKLVGLLSALLVLMMAIPSFSPSVVFAAEGETALSEDGEEIDDPEDESGEDFVDEEDSEEDEDEEAEEDIVLLSEDDEDEEFPEVIEEECNFIVQPIEGKYLYSNASRPVVTVTDLNGTKLTKNKEYTIEFVNHDIPGEAKAVVTGIGSYFGTVEMPYRTYYNVQNVLDISAIDRVQYTGEAITPEPTVSYQGKTLVKGVDYTIAYENNINAGTATVYINGIGKYDGQNKVKFMIDKADVSITISNLKVPYSLKKQTIKLSPKCSSPDATLTYSLGSTQKAGIDDNGVVTVQPKYTDTIGKITIHASSSANYKPASKTIKIVPIVKDFPYKNDTHVYTKVSTTGKAVVKQLRNHNKTVVVNFKIKTSKSINEVFTAIMDFANEYKSKSWPVVMKESSKTSKFSYDTGLSYGFKYKGYAYGSIVLKPQYLMSKSKEISAIKGIVKTVKDIGATSGSIASRRKKIYTWITKNIKYAYKKDDDGKDVIYLNDGDTRFSTAQKTFYYKKGVCEGYSQLMTSMCYVAGVDCFSVYSIYHNGCTHAWNMIKNGTKWYQCDSCWDAGSSSTHWNYYMKPYDATWKQRKWHQLDSRFLKMDGVTLAK